jgi:hypothetical protein
MKILDLQGLCASTAFVLLALVILIRRKRLTHEDIGPLFSTFMAAGTLPIALHLCSFVLPTRHASGDLVFPDQYALYISAAGLILLVSSCVTICQLFAIRIRRESRRALETEKPEPSDPSRDPELSAPQQQRRTARRGGD